MFRVLWAFKSYIRIRQRIFWITTYIHNVSLLFLHLHQLNDREGEHDMVERYSLHVRYIKEPGIVRNILYYII